MLNNLINSNSLYYLRAKTALLQGISLFKDPMNFLSCPVFALAAALLMQTASCKRLFLQFIINKREAVCVENVAELSLVELLETDEENTPLQAENNTPPTSRCPGAQDYVNRLLSTIKDIAQTKQVKLTPDLTSHSFRRGGWQLDRANKTFAYILGTAKADQKVARLRALEEPNLSSALKLQALLYADTLGFADPTLNLDEELAEGFTAILVMHYPDMLLLADSSAFIVGMRESLVALAIGEAEMLRCDPASIHTVAGTTESYDCSTQYTALDDLLKKHSEPINILILQNKRIEERLLAVETLKATTERPLSESRGDTVRRD
ncbi:LOW QUALITY PROTEIN: Hypothetical protein PHPALM_19623 [Phytophthora palmivora]|uniref:Uncharacterized protein n=1 Tax=Phytophthora palmivora TaxID=4796 RepID=A0A2P4XGY9_9STRA|nr:LOW QUALITY PROTEIN: Hypothetical protein PHPALM_19623 [Phytophthora palmivora]